MWKKAGYKVGRIGVFLKEGLVTREGSYICILIPCLCVFISHLQRYIKWDICNYMYYYYLLLTLVGVDMVVLLCYMPLELMSYNAHVLFELFLYQYDIPGSYNGR